MRSAIVFAGVVSALIALRPSVARSAEDDAAVGREESLSNVVQLTSGFAKAGEAYFSPDMQWIIFQAAPQGAEQYQMFLAKLKRDAAGEIIGAEQPIQISPEPSRNTCGYFSPDGNTIIFASTFGKEKPDEPNSGYQRQGGKYRWAFPEGMEIFACDNWKAYIKDAAPGSKVPLIGPGVMTARALTDNNVYDAECAFSPDGKWICFGSNQNNNVDVYVMKVARQTRHGGEPTNHAIFSVIEPAGQPIRITTAEGYDGGPFFAPDGKRLVYRGDRQKNDLLQVFVADLAFDDKGDITGVKQEHQLTNDANVNWGPYFHPDNQHIIYATSRHGHANYELYLMRDDGSHQVRITYTPKADVLPVFSPDGKYLMWTSQRSKEGTSQVFIAKFTMPKDG
jgi:Tol biopolymer transport system component